MKGAQMSAEISSYILGAWASPDGQTTALVNPIDGECVANLVTGPTDFLGVVRHAREVGGPNLQALTFHQRAEMLKKLATALDAGKDKLRPLSLLTGATQRDGMIDIDGGVGTLWSYASKGRRELPDEHFLIDGERERLSKGGAFAGQHLLTPLSGVAVHINAFNFPCWGMLEKLAPALLAGIPMIVKPATATAYLTHAMFQQIIDSGVLPEGAIQLVLGPIGNMFDALTGQDVVSFTGSLGTSIALRNHPVMATNAVRFIAERDSLNAAILGPDADTSAPEFDLLVKEVAREMTVKAGQKCTAVRRILVPEARVEDVIGALKARLAKTVVGDPRLEGVTMGPLVSLAQRDDVRRQTRRIAEEAAIVHGDPTDGTAQAKDPKLGAFMSPLLLKLNDAAHAHAVHEVEAFGPVATVVPYRDTDDLVALARRGGGSLVASVFTGDDDFARKIAFGIAPFHGRLAFIDRDCAAESTGHGSPLPTLVHGGPGRAGGGEELGGLRGLHHYLQRTAIQGSPRRLSSLSKRWEKGAPEATLSRHPFQICFDDLKLGDTLNTAPRTVTLEDIEHFAHFTGDTFYAHMDEEAAKANPFFPGRVAHGYLILSFAAGLFVEPSPGPVLANYGLDNLRFVKPLSPAESIAVRLTVKQKTRRNPQYGEVRWDVEVTNGAGETVAQYDLLTMNAMTFPLPVDKPKRAN